MQKSEAERLGWLFEFRPRCRMKGRAELRRPDTIIEIQARGDSPRKVTKLLLDEIERFSEK